MLALNQMPAQVEQGCKGASTGLFARLRQAASENPAVALACLAQLSSEVQREYILQLAFSEALVLKPEIARRYIAQVIDRPWLAEAGYFPLARLATAVIDTDAQMAKTLLVAAVTRHPSVALREVRSYIDLRYGQEVFEVAVLSAPDEAVGLASGNSPTAEAVLRGLGASRRPELQVLASLAADRSHDPITRERMAVFGGEIAAGRLSIGEVAVLASGGAYFPALAKLRIGAPVSRAVSLDHVLETYAQILFRSLQGRNASGIAGELRSFEARDLYLLLTYGRTETDDALFTMVFDRILLPKMSAARRHSTVSALSRLLDEVHDLNLRQFLTTAAAHHRLDAFLATAATKVEQSILLARCVQGIERARNPLNETLTAAAIMEGVRDATRLQALRMAVFEEYGRVHKSGNASASALYGLLFAEVARQLPEPDAVPDPAFRELSKRYRPYFQEPRALNVEALFDAGGRCLQQHFFYDDPDGVESFASFKQVYQGDPRWRWEDRGTYVYLTGHGSSGRRIEIFANLPTYPPPTDAANRRHALTKMLTDRGLSPSVVVHRGHSFFLEQSLRYLTNSARLVYLGSCRGQESVHAVIAIAGRAQLIVTRNVGTQTINDPLLKAINDELLRGNKTLDWDKFWRTQEARFGRNPMFRDYIPPSRNGSAILLSAYYLCLADESE